MRAVGWSMPRSKICRAGAPSLDTSTKWGRGREQPPGALSAAWTHLLGTELFIPNVGTQQGPEGTKELPPRPVLDHQEHIYVLADALCSQSANLQGKEIRDLRGVSPNPVKVTEREEVEGGLGDAESGFIA